VTRALISIALLNLTLACGELTGAKDEGSSECSSGCVGDGKIERAAAKDIVIDIDGSGIPTNYLIVPFVLGNTAVVNGAASSETTKSFTVSHTQSSSTGASGMAALAPRYLSIEGYQHGLRTFWNHYHHQRLNLADGRVQRELVALSQFRQQSSKAAEDDQPSLFMQARRYENFRATRDRIRSRAETTAACPEEIFRMGSDEPLNENLLTRHEHSQGDFCLVLVKDGVLKSETSVEKIKDSIASSLTTYKLIYGSDFGKTRDSYAFKPLVIVVPMDDSTVWPQEAIYQLQGAFVSDLTEDHGRPTIYLPADMTKVGVEAKVATTAFHAAIAHEMQHAVMNYFRVWVPETPLEEVTSIDEGVAHFMEDLLGYGELNFNLFPKTFLATAAVAPEPVLMDQSTFSVSETARGAAQTLVYYLVSQKGGVKFSGGMVDADASPGLGFIRSFVMGSKIGVQGMELAFGENWADALGGYYGALYVDNAEDFKANPRFSVQTPESGVIDTSGTEGKLFGMRFNDFSGLPKVSERLSQISVLKFGSASAAHSGEVQFYQPSPLMVANNTDARQIVISFANAEQNIGATVIRVK
jgi:hypothetical protein